MRENGHYVIAREGWTIIAVTAILAITSLVYIGIIAFIIFFCLLGISLVVFRNPSRVIPPQPLAIVSPADGNLLSIENVDDPWLSRSATCFRINVSFWNIHALRSPVEGKVMGEWPSANNGKTNRQYAYWIKTDEDDDIILSLVLGKMSPFVKMALITGERIGQGQVCGFYIIPVLSKYTCRRVRVLNRISRDPSLPVQISLGNLFVHK